MAFDWFGNIGSYLANNGDPMTSGLGSSSYENAINTAINSISLPEQQQIQTQKIRPSKFGKIVAHGVTDDGLRFATDMYGNRFFENGTYYDAINNEVRNIPNFDRFRINGNNKPINTGQEQNNNVYAEEINQPETTNKSQTSIPSTYRSGSGLDIGELQNKLRSIDGITQKYGEANLSDRKFGKNTLSAMIDVFNYLDNYGLSPQNSSNINNDSSTSNKDKIEALQTMLKQYGYVGADGKSLTVDGKFGKNTAEAFSRYLDDKLRMKNEIDSNAIRMQDEQRQLAEQQAREQAERDAYRNSPAVRAEQPRRDMFSGVNLGIPDYMQPEDYAQPTQRIVRFDYYGRPIYE